VKHQGALRRAFFMACVLPAQAALLYFVPVYAMIRWGVGSRTIMGE
jgi:hypothetical protein